MEIQTITPNRTNSFFLTLSAPGTLVGATVSAIVFTTLTTTGEIAAAATGTGIELTGNVLAYGTELTIGTLAANNIRTISRTCSAIARPTITNTSRLSALGISVLAGTGAAFTTSAIIYGGKQVSSYLYSCYEDYKQKIANTIQQPIEISSDLIVIDDDDIQIIEEELPQSIEMKSIHSQQDV